ncbi:MAG: ABC transporter substrate-binding protein [Gemmatimonadetes bacterium]|nr:ABC transporter substrate-binding protein [Gemmatimonadota bacterium]
MAVLSAITPRGRTRRAMVRLLMALALTCGAVACGTAAGDRAGEDRLSREAGAADVAALDSLPWDSVVARARGTTVTWRMWRGDPSINAYVDGWLAPQLRERFGISLEAVDGQGAELVNALVVEREAGRTRGTASLLWINGETFASLRHERLLAGPFAQRLPNARFVDSASAIISRDFEQEPLGFESPWGTVQFALIYDSVRTPTPPRTVAELRAWILAHPGRFTHDQGFAGATFLKGVMYALSGGVATFAGGFDSTRYEAGRDTLFAWLAGVTPSFWRRGETYPPDVAAMHRLFANGEIDFSMSNNQNEAVVKARQGVLPPTVRALVLRDGMIANTHYVGIPASAPNAAGAMVVADFLLSPEAQLEKAKVDVWGDGTVLATHTLPPEWRASFAALDGDPRAVPRDTLTRYARPEVAPAYHERLLRDWRRRFRTGGP